MPTALTLNPADAIDNLWGPLLLLALTWLVLVPLVRVLLAGAMYLRALHTRDAHLRARALRTLPGVLRLALGAAIGLAGVAAPAFAASPTPTLSADRLAVAPLHQLPAAPAKAAPAAADDERLEVQQASGLRSYTVQRGDCLWDIAESVYGLTDHADIDTHWREIWRTNRVTIGADPGIITPGMVLTLPGDAR